MKITPNWQGIGAAPFAADLRKMSYADQAQAAIAAWNKGHHMVALAWVGKGLPDDITIHGQSVYLTYTSDPTGGNSPRPITTTCKLTGDPASCALAKHIIATEDR